MTIEKAAELFLEEEQLATGQCYKIVPNQLFNKFFSWLEEKGIEVQTRQPIKSFIKIIKTIF